VEILRPGAGEAQSGKRPARLRVCKEGNRLLKGLLIGAAKSIISGESPYAEHYRAFASASLHPNTARRHLARQLATTLWTLWKKGTRYDPSRIRVNGLVGDLITGSSTPFERATEFLVGHWP